MLEQEDINTTAADYDRDCSHHDRGDLEYEHKVYQWLEGMRHVNLPALSSTEGCQGVVNNANRTPCYHTYLSDAHTCC